MGEDELGELFMRITLHRMTDLYRPKLQEALSTISLEELWSEPYPSGNPVGSIVLHVTEHVARSSLRLHRHCDQLQPNFERFFPAGDQTPEQLIQLFEGELLSWKIFMLECLSDGTRMDPEQMHQLYHVVEHTGYHLGQIIDRVQASTGKKFSFAQNGLNEAYLRRQIEEGKLDEQIH